MSSIADSNFRVITQNSDFTFIHSASGSPSDIDHFVSSTPSLDFDTLAAHVNDECTISDHLGISLNLPCRFTSSKPRQDWREVSEWEKINKEHYWTVLNDLLAKIRVPFQLLEENSTEDRIALEIYTWELIHTLKFVQKCSVLTSCIKLGAKKPDWNSPDTKSAK
jgi:hypothetical protein